LTQFFVESCVDFEVAHLSVFMVWRLPYPEVPTLNMQSNGYHGEEFVRIARWV